MEYTLFLGRSNLNFIKIGLNIGIAMSVILLFNFTEILQFTNLKKDK